MNEYRAVIGFDSDDSKLISTEHIAKQLNVGTREAREMLRRAGVMPVAFAGREKMYERSALTVLKTKGTDARGNEDEAEAEGEGA